MHQNGESRLRALGRLVERRRVALGLRPGELALRARLGRCAAIGGGVVRTFEIAGKADLVTIVRLLEVLEIDHHVVLKTSGLDLHALRQHWDQWAVVEVPITLSVRLMAAVWHVETAPAGVSRDEVLEWARSHPEWKSCLRCLRWSRTHCTYLRQDGTSYEVNAAFPEGCPEPLMFLP